MAALYSFLMSLVNSTIRVLSLESFLEHRTRGSHPKLPARGSPHDSGAPERGTSQRETRGAKLTHRRMLATQGPSLPPFCSLTKTHVIKSASFHRLECVEQQGAPGRVGQLESHFKTNCGCLLVTLTSSVFRLPPRPRFGHKCRVMGCPGGKGNFT